MKKIKNSQPQTKFTGSYKKKECTIIDPQSKGINWTPELDSSNCNFQDELITPVTELFHGVHHFTQETESFLLPFVYQVDPYFAN